jgi:hypothetical protein
MSCKMVDAPGKSSLQLTSKQRSRCFGIIEGHDLFFFNVGHTV